jgi:peptidoglycan hydrolase-like protein with peptidoglycan-binding domain
LPVVSRESTGAIMQLPRPRPATAEIQKQDAAHRIDPVPLPRPRAPIAPSGAHPDQIAYLLNPSRQLITVQRVLNEFGYGPIKLSGTLDESTKEGIERFERDHNLTVTGQNSPRLRRELSLATGRSLD